MQPQLDLVEAEAQVLAELSESPESRWEAETEAREQARRVEAELDAIKERHRNARETR
jgi:hypothetical protein